MKKILVLTVMVCFATLTSVVGIVLANHATVNHTTFECGETTFSASADGSAIGNMYLVVEADGAVQFANIPTNGSSADITVGPFFDTTTLYWRVFGGGERDLDQPLWNGYGTPTFAADISAYAASVGTFNWVIAGTSDPNPFTTWNSFNVDGCATIDACRDGGWEAYGFRNQGQCIRFVNTGQDSR